MCGGGPRLRRESRMLKNAGIRVCGENSVPTRCRLQIYNEKEPWIGSRERNGEPSVKTMSADLVRAINGSSAEPARQRGRLRSSRVGQRLPMAFRGAPRSAATIWEGSFFLDSSRRRASEMETLSASARANGGTHPKSPSNVTAQRRSLRTRAALQEHARCGGG